jgi:hypothetical protein
MAVTLNDIKSEVLLLLQKSQNYQGFFSDDKIYSAIRESYDYLQTHLLDAAGGLWQTNVVYFDTVSNQTDQAIPDYVIMIKEIRYKIINQYIPLYYDARYETREFSADSGVTQFPNRYGILNNKIHFNPAIGVGGPQYLMLEYFGLTTDVSSLDSSLQSYCHRIFQHYIKYRSASILASSIGKFNKEWERLENEWYDAMLKSANKRIMSTNYVKDFEG